MDVNIKLKLSYLFMRKKAFFKVKTRVKMNQISTKEKCHYTILRKFYVPINVAYSKAL